MDGDKIRTEFAAFSLSVTVGELGSLRLVLCSSSPLTLAPSTLKGVHLWPSQGGNLSDHQGR